MKSRFHSPARPDLTAGCSLHVGLSPTSSNVTVPIRMELKRTSDGVDLHFIHQRGTGTNRTPLLLLHGWPSSFVQMLALVPLRTDPASSGGDATDSFDVVAFLPGHGLSGSPTGRPMTVVRMGEAFHTLMTDEFGYHRYGILASDIDAGVQAHMALAYPQALTGIHRTGSYVPFVPDDLSEVERAYIEREQAEGAHAHVHRTKPQTLASGWTTPRSGWAAWIIEKFGAWSDCGAMSRCRSELQKDELLTNIAIYWFTQTINSSIRVYRDDFGPDGLIGIPDVPTGHLMGHEQIANAPEEWTRRLYRIDHYVESDRGGHFLEWEEPEIVANDLREFFRPLRSRA